MGFFDSIGKVLNPSNWVGDSGNGLLDLIDPGNTFHTGQATRAADRQFQMEYDIAKKNYDEQVRMNDFNIAQQKQAFEYQKELNRLQMEREDTATSRRVADLKASGLSPTLAAGSAAETGAMHAGSAPQGVAPQMGTPSDVKVQAAMFKEGLLKDRMQLATTLMSNMADVARTRAETELLNAQSNQLNAWTPIDLKLKEQLYDFNDQINPYRISDMISFIQNRNADTFYKERQSFLVDSQRLLNDSQLLLNQDIHGLNILRSVEMSLNNRLLGVKIDRENQDYIEHAIAIEMARAQLKSYQFKQDFYENTLGVPVDYNFGYLSAPIGLGAGSGRKAKTRTWKEIANDPRDPFALPKVKDFVNRVFDKADHLMQQLDLLPILTRITGGAFDFSDPNYLDHY